MSKGEKIQNTKLRIEHSTFFEPWKQYQYFSEKIGSLEGDTSDPHDFKLQARLRFFTAKLLFVLVLLQNDLDEIKIIATKIPPLLSLPCALLLDVLVT